MELFEKDNVLGMLSEIISEGILIVNEQQQITTSNNAANEMFGYQEAELQGKPLGILIPKHSRNKHGTLVSGFMHEGKARQMGKGLDLMGLRKNGEDFPLEISLNPFELNNERYVLALIMDITEKKKA